MPEITVKLKDKVLETRTFDGGFVRIGRSRENDIILENLSVSREHAQIRYHDDRYTIIDLNSANGTMVNGVRVSKAEIVHEDVITIGKHKLYFSNPAAFTDDDDSSGISAQHTVVMEQRAEAYFAVRSGRLQGREFPIVRFETSLGKAATNDIVLTDDWLLAKKQAVILRKANNEFEIQDLGGLRKVKVNGKAINGKAMLHDEDVVEVGGTSMIFHAATAAPAPHGSTHPAAIPTRPAPVSSAEMAALAAAADTGSGFAAHSGIKEDSLDLEENYHSVKLSFTGGDSAGAAPARPSMTPEEAEEFESDVEQDSIVTPSVDFAPQDAVDISDESVGAEDDDSGDTADGAPPHAPAADPAPSASPDDIERVVASYEDIPLPPGVDEKEVKMWEEALRNPSPAIQRQAVRMLKKLTGRNYDL